MFPVPRQTWPLFWLSPPRVGCSGIDGKKTAAARTERVNPGQSSSVRCPDTMSLFCSLFFNKFSPPDNDYATAEISVLERARVPLRPRERLRDINQINYAPRRRRAWDLSLMWVIRVCPSKRHRGHIQRFAAALSTAKNILKHWFTVFTNI